DETLSTKNSHSGDSFTATLSEPLRSSHGDVLIPSGARLLGTVQDAESGKVFASMRGKGKLILRFNSISLKRRINFPLPRMEANTFPDSASWTVPRRRAPEGMRTSPWELRSGSDKVAVKLSPECEFLVERVSSVLTWNWVLGGMLVASGMCVGAG